MNKYKKQNAVLFIAGILMFLLTKTYWSYVCEVKGCSFSLLEGVMEPLIPFSLMLISVSGLLLTLPSDYFKGWLFKIASWFFPLALVIVLSVDINSSSVFSLSRAQVTQFCGYGLGLVTLIYIAVHYWRNK